MSKSDYQSTKARIKADYTSDKAACGSQTGNAKDVCIQEGKAKEKVALAETGLPDPSTAPLGVV